MGYRGRRWSLAWRNQRAQNYNTICRGHMPCPDVGSWCSMPCHKRGTRKWRWCCRMSAHSHNRDCLLSVATIGYWKKFRVNGGSCMNGGSNSEVPTLLSSTGPGTQPAALSTWFNKQLWCQMSKSRHLSLSQDSLSDLRFLGQNI